MNRGRFSDKVALITGASSGLGRACALKLLSEGAQVLAVASSAEKLQQLQNEAGSERLAHFACDVSQADNCQKAVAAAIAQFGKLDILLNVAGVHRFSHTHSISAEDWQQDLAINLNAPFFLSQAAIPALLKTHGLSLIHI